MLYTFAKPAAIPPHFQVILGGLYGIKTVWVPAGIRLHCCPSAVAQISVFWASRSIPPGKLKSAHSNLNDDVQLAAWPAWHGSDLTCMQNPASFCGEPPGHVAGHDCAPVLAVLLTHVLEHRLLRHASWPYNVSTSTAGERQGHGNGLTSR